MIYEIVVVVHFKLSTAVFLLAANENENEKMSFDREARRKIINKAEKSLNVKKKKSIDIEKQSVCLLAVHFLVY